MLYRERLLPGPTILLLGVGLFLMIGIAYSAAFGNLVGIVLALSISALSLILAVATAPQIRVEVREGEYSLTAGRATVSIAIIGSMSELTPLQRLDLTRGRHSDTAYSIIKGKLPVVELEIIDPLDPHGTWCLSSRNPGKFIDAILSARGPKNA